MIGLSGANQEPISERRIDRLARYRRSLQRLLAQGMDRVYSHELAARSNATPAQVRRDLMQVDHSVNPARGYMVQELVENIGRLLDPPKAQPVVLVGVGNLGRALLTHLADQDGPLRLVAAFDTRCDLLGTTIADCPCHHPDQLPWIVRQHGVTVGIITVPAGEAQRAAERLIRSGVRGLVNLAPVELVVPEGVVAESIDIGLSLEKVAYFARQLAAADGSGNGQANGQSATSTAGGRSQHTDTARHS